MEIFEQANEFHRNKQFAEAEKLYDQLLTQNHRHPHLLATVGSLYLETGKTGLAIALLEASMHYDKTLRQSDIMANLGMAYYRSGQIEKAKEYLERAIKAEGASAQAFASYSALFIESGHPEKIIGACEKAIAKNASLPIAHWNMSMALLGQGNFERGWDEYEWGLESVGMRPNRKIGEKTPYWDGTPGKTVVVYGEQGIGDEIMFASMLPDLLKTNTVILESHKRLKTLFEKSFPVVVHGTREEREPQWPKDHQIDYRMSIGSLGKYYRRSRAAFPGTPYLKAEPLLPKGKFRVGISWTGGLKEGRVLKRSVPLSWWKPILEQPCEFVSLQYTDCDEEIDLVNALGYDIKRFPEVKMEDYYETARLVQSCDLVISVCTSVVHLAGALGVPCWVMTPKNPAWRYQDTGGMPWYQSVRLYRQPDTTQDSWFPVIKHIAMDLNARLV